MREALTQDHLPCIGKLNPVCSSRRLIIMACNIIIDRDTLMAVFAIVIFFHVSADSITWAKSHCVMCMCWSKVTRHVGRFNHLQWSDRWSYISSGSLRCQWTVQNAIIWPSDEMLSRRSKNNNGPITVPCGTPDFTSELPTFARLSPPVWLVWPFCDWQKCMFKKWSKKLRNLRLVSSWHATRPAQLTCPTHPLVCCALTTSGVSVATRLVQNVCCYGARTRADLHLNARTSGHFVLYRCTKDVPQLQSCYL